MTRTAGFLALFAVLILSPFATAQYHAWRWTPAKGIQDLGDLPNCDFAQAFAINNSGEVVGTSGKTPGESGFRWTAKAGMQPLLQGGGMAAAQGVNSSGTIAGWAIVSGNHQAVYWSAGGALVQLGSLGIQEQWSFAYAINTAGMIVGQTAVPLTDTGHAFVWTATGGMQDLGTLFGRNAASSASAVNDNGDIVGWSNNQTGNTHAVVWKDGEIKDLGTLPNGFTSHALGINNAGLIVGDSDSGTSHGSPHAVLWYPDGAIHDLGTGSGGYSFALGINNSSQVTGYYETSHFGFVHPFIWTQAGGIQDLGVLKGFPNGFGSAINDAGVVAGISLPQGP
ncbi:MAG: hypothetical protein WB562_00990 [Candidatus Sulfotelmatobacter sp.]